MFMVYRAPQRKKIQITQNQIILNKISYKKTIQNIHDTPNTKKTLCATHKRSGAYAKCTFIICAKCNRVLYIRDVRNVLSRIKRESTLQWKGGSCKK